MVLEWRGGGSNSRPWGYESLLAQPPISTSLYLQVLSGIAVITANQISLHLSTTLHQHYTNFRFQLERFSLQENAFLLNDKLNRNINMSRSLFADGLFSIDFGKELKIREHYRHR